MPTVQQQQMMKTVIMKRVHFEVVHYSMLIQTENSLDDHILAEVHQRSPSNELGTSHLFTSNNLMLLKIARI